MKKHEIDPIPLIANSEPHLAGDEREVIAQLNQEVFQMKNERFFQFAFRVFIFEAQEFKHERISDLFLRSKRILRVLSCTEPPFRSFRAFIKQC